MRQLAAIFWSAVEIQDGGDGGWMALIINMLVGVFVNKRKTRLNPRFRDKGPNVKVGKV